MAIELERADLRIQQICDKIRNETLEPAKQEASALIEEAKKEAARIIAAAKQKADDVLASLKNSLEEERRVFESSLQQACKQTLEQLKLSIEEQFFHPKLAEWVEKELGKEKEHARLLEVLVEAIRKEGTSAELSALIPKKFSAETLSALLSKQILDELKDKSVRLTDIPAGVLIKVVDKHMVIDMSSDALVDIVSSYIRKDFRRVFFT